MREKLSDYLSGWLGGPLVYFRRPDATCIMSAHRHFHIGAPERDQWMDCMRQALAESPLPAGLRGAIETGLSRMCDAMVNAPTASRAQSPAATPITAAEAGDARSP
jgi:hemoglobin